MAVDIKVYCDKCGDRIVQDRTNLKATCGLLRLRDPIDLCGDCTAALTGWLGPIPGRKAEPAKPAATPAATKPATWAERRRAASSSVSA